MSQRALKVGLDKSSVGYMLLKTPECGILALIDDRRAESPGKVNNVPAEKRHTADEVKDVRHINLAAKWVLSDGHW